MKTQHLPSPRRFNLRTLKPLTLSTTRLPLAALLCLVATLALLPAAAQAQGAIEAWVQRYDGPGNGEEDYDYVRAMVVDTNGNVYVTGVSTVFWATIKYSSDGVPLWTNLHVSPGDNSGDPAALAVDTSGNVYVTGSTSDPVSRFNYCATIKYSGDGVPLWTNRYTQHGGGGMALAVDGSGNVFVAANFYTGVWPDGDYEFWTIKYSGAGALSWAKSYNGAGNSWDGANAMAVDAAGNVIVTGESDGYITIKYSSDGLPLWTNRYNGMRATAVAVDTAGNVYVTGLSFFANTYSDYATLKYSSAGVPLWTNCYDGPISGSDEAKAVAVDIAGNVVVTGVSDGISSGQDYLTIKYSTTGLPLWTNRYNGPGNAGDLASAVALDASGNVYVTGQSWGIGTSSDYATVAYSSAGVPLWTNRYGWPGNNRDGARAVALDASGNVYVSGSSSTSGDDYPHAYDFATVKYVIAPAIARQPLSRTNSVGTTANFSVEAASGTPLSYQWRRQETNLVNGGNVSGVSTTNLLIANVQLADAAAYTVVVTNVYGSATSHVAQLTVYVPPNPGRFTNLSYSLATGFSFIFRDATVGKSYRIQTSPSLAEGSWADWMSFNYTGPMLLTDLGAVESTNKFYRAISP